MEREVSNVNQEIKGTIASDGSIILPPGVLETMGAGPGDQVQIVYESQKPVRAENSYGKLYLSADGLQKTACMELPEEAEMKLPHALLEEAGIPLGAELVVQTAEGAVLIGEREPLLAARKPFYGMLRLLEMTEKEAMKILEKGGFLDG
mgnify:CR=1 FL=1